MARKDDFVDLTKSPDPTGAPAKAVDMDGVAEEDDEDLKLAIAMSLQDQAEAQEKQALATTKGFKHDPPLEYKIVMQDQDVKPVGLFALDRKKMEAERLARLKRKRDGKEEADEPVRNARLAPPRKLRSISPPATRRKSQDVEATSSSLATAVEKQPQPVAAASELASSVSHKLYPDGVVLKTYAPGYPEDRTIKFDELIAPVGSLKSCMLSSFIWDFDWLFPHFNTKMTKFLLVMHAKWPQERQQIEADFADVPNVKICLPPMDGQINCMHSKLMLLFWDDRCRVVVPTANLMGFDWGVGSVMENMLWLIDLPVYAEAASKDRTETAFLRNMKRFLHAQTVPGSLIERLDRYGFSKTKDVGFVYTIGGAHSSNESLLSNGYCGLGKTVGELNLRQNNPIEVDFITSSLGSLDEEFMRRIYLAAQGDDGLAELTLRVAKVFPARKVGTTSTELVPKTKGQDWKGRFRVYFPSQEIVEASNGSKANAGTICFSQKWWDKSTFPRHALWDCVSERDGLLMHNKVILVRFVEQTTVHGEKCAGYAYIGSANMSESAWGRLIQDRSTKELRMNCRNYESGVVVKVGVPALGHSGGSYPGNGGKDQDLAATFSNTIPVPIRMKPAVAFESSSRKPWFFQS